MPSGNPKGPNLAPLRLCPSNLCLSRFVIAGLFLFNLSSLVHAQPTDAVRLRQLTYSLLNAKSPQEREDLLAANKDFVTVALRRWVISEGTTLVAEGKYAKAMEAFDIAKAIAEQIQDSTGIAAASLNRGTVFFIQGNYDAALESYQRARAIFAKTKDQLELARALMGIGFVYKEQGKLNEALDYLKQSQREFESLSATTFKDELADVLNAIGSVYQSQGNHREAIKVFESGLSRRDDPQSVLRLAGAFYSQGNYLQAIEYYEKVLQRIELEPEKHGEALSIAVFGNLANVYYRLGNYDLSLQYYQRNLHLVEKIGDKAGIAVTLEGIGNVHRQLGDYGAALESYLQSVQSAAESSGRVSPATALSHIGTIRAAQGNAAEALEYFRKSRNEFEIRADNVGMARALINIGNSAYTLGDFPLALDAFQKALSLRESMNDRAGMADALLGIGTTHAAQRNFVLALETLRRGLAINEDLRDNEGIARVLREMAKCFALQNDHAQALVLIERAVASAKLSGSRDLQWRTNLDKGKYSYALDRMAEARQALEQSIRVLEDLQTSSCVNFLDLTSPSEVIEPYAQLVRLLVDDGKAEEAFITLERGKSEAFRSILRKDELRISKPLTDAEKKEERSTFTALLALEIELARERVRRVPDEKAIAAAAAKLGQAQTTCGDSRRKMYLRYPQLRVYRGELPRLKSVVDAASFVADGNTAILDFLVTDATTYLFVLTRESNSRGRVRSNRSSLRLQVYPIPVGRGEVAARVANFVQLIANREEAAMQSAMQFYDLLLKPAEELLRTKTKLVIAPDRELWGLPFQALQTDQNRYLIEQAAISYVPSVSVMSVVSRPPAARRRATRVSTSVIFVNPTVNETITRRVELTSGGSSVVSIPETKAISFTKTLSGSNANEDAAKLEFSNHNLVNLSTTTVIDDASPLASYAVLAPAPDSKTDGLLHAWETFQVNSSAQVVLMPFAAPARKQMDTGTGVTAMAWSWFVAGTPTTIISQWSADPARTLELLEKFRALTTTQQTSSAVALQTVTRTFLKTNPEYNHPFYWSGLRLIGNR